MKAKTKLAMRHWFGFLLIFGGLSGILSILEFTGLTRILIVSASVALVAVGIWLNPEITIG